MQIKKRHGFTAMLAAWSLIGGAVTFAESALTAGKSATLAPAPAMQKANSAKKDKKDKSDGNKKEDNKKSDAKSDVGSSKKSDAPTQAGTVDCQMQAAPAGLAGVSEASGIAASRRTAGVLWSHGDSYVGEPVLYAFDTKGGVRGKVRIEGIKVADWEDINVGPCGGSTCLYIADIGDNQVARKSITVHRMPEPLPTDASARVIDSFQMTFPDGAHDAEAMFVSPSGEVFIVTKGETGPIAVYRLGGSPKAGSSNQLQKVGVVQSGPLSRNQWITGASASPDGKWIAMRTHGSVSFYNADRLMRGDMTAPLRLDVASLKEPQGEGVSFGSDGALYLAGESGRKGASGTLASGVCKLPS